MDLCFYECGREADTDDHIITASRGGTDAPINLLRACVQCNSERGDLPVEDFIRIRGLNKPLPRGQTDIEYKLLNFSIHDLHIKKCQHCGSAYIALKKGTRVAGRWYRGIFAQGFCSERHRKKYSRRVNKLKKAKVALAAAV